MRSVRHAVNMLAMEQLDYFSDLITDWRFHEFYFGI